MSEFKLPSNATVGIYEGDPCVSTPGLSLVMYNGAWFEDSSAFFWNGIIMSIEDWLAEFPDLPPLPKTAFHFDDKAGIAAE